MLRASGGRNTLGNGVHDDQAGDGGRGGLSATLVTGEAGEDYLSDYEGDHLYAAGGGGGAGGRVLLREWGRPPVSLGRFVAPGAGGAVGICTSYAAAEVIAGDSIVSSASEVANLSNLRCISGDLVIRAPGKVDLPKLEVVGGDLIIAGAHVSGTGHAPTELALSALTHVVGDLSIVDNAELTAFTAPKLLRLDGHLAITRNSLLSQVALGISKAASVDLIDNAKLQTVDFHSLTSVTGSLVAASNAVLAVLDIQSLTTVGGDITVIHDNALADGVVSKLGSVGGRIVVEDNAKLQSVEARALVHVGGSIAITKNASLKTVDVSALQDCVRFDLADNAALATLAVQHLSALSDLRIARNLKLASLSFDALTSATTVSIFGSHKGGHAALGTCSFPVLKTAATWFLIHRADYPLIRAPRLASVGDLGFMDNAQLTQLAFPLLNKVSGKFAAVYNDRLPACEALDLRDQVKSGGGISGSVDIVGNLDVCSPNPCGGTLVCTEDCTQAKDYVCK